MQALLRQLDGLHADIVYNQTQAPVTGQPTLIDITRAPLAACSVESHDIT